MLLGFMVYLDRLITAGDIELKTKSFSDQENLFTKVVEKENGFIIE